MLDTPLVVDWYRHYRTNQWTCAFRKVVESKSLWLYCINATTVLKTRHSLYRILCSLFRGLVGQRILPGSFKLSLNSGTVPHELSGTIWFFSEGDIGEEQYFPLDGKGDVEMVATRMVFGNTSDSTQSMKWWCLIAWTWVCQKKLWTNSHSNVSTQLSIIIFRFQKPIWDQNVIHVFGGDADESIR